MDRFIAGATEIFRQSGEPAAIALADLLGAAGSPVAGSIEPTRVPAIVTHLDSAVNAADAHPLLGILQCDLLFLDWQEAEWGIGMPSDFVGRYGFVELVGPDGMLPHAGFRFGLYLQAPMTYYPRHWHAAEEFYFLLSGMAEWRRGDNPANALHSDDLIRHASGEPHAMRTFAMPLLAMWAWVGDLGTESYRIDAGDWY
jgi:mannose-6-phosphate isomerase-like protein (cupin superfamily)